MKISISIHALLAESDPRRQQPRQTQRYFYPRSPCGERPPVREIIQWEGIFLSTLSLRRATRSRSGRTSTSAFLSTLSLRRATAAPVCPGLKDRYFYPRSPCGERLRRATGTAGSLAISIHALLAESDYGLIRPIIYPTLFLSTLSLRRATQ